MHNFKSPNDWLDHEIKNNQQNPERLLQILLQITPLIDGDQIQDTFQDDMDDQGYFYNLETDPLDEANPDHWSTESCIWFIENRLGRKYDHNLDPKLQVKNALDEQE